MRPAVFVDRDDTLIVNGALDWSLVPEGSAIVAGDLCNPDWVRPLDGAVEACRDLKSAGYAVVVITNQGLVARGGGVLAEVYATHDRMRAFFVDTDGSPLLEGVYAAPHHPKGRVEPFNVEHPWRKPAGGMLLAAAVELGLDLSASWMIGDMDRDAEAGVAAGLDPARCLRIGPDADIPDLVAATALVLRAHKESRAGRKAPA